MNKPVVGIVVGAILGVLDGATAYFEPKVRPQIALIMMASGVKGMIVGVLCGVFARKVNSNAAGIGVGAAVGGKKGALIGAAIGGGGAAIWDQITRRK